MHIFSKLLILLIVFSIGLGFGHSTVSKDKTQNIQTIEKNIPKAFISEVYDKIKDNYWDNISDAQLKDLFKIATQNNGGQLNEESAAKIAQAVLSSLNPAGRSGLYTQKNEEQLKNTVNNVNPEKDLYKDLGVKKEASREAIAQAYQEKLKTEKSEEKIKQLTYARDVLTKDDTKNRYDSTQVEPTIFTKIVRPGILYLQFKKFSPTSLDEFVKAFDSYKDDSALYGLIFDLRGNVGGAIDASAYFLGNFIGKNQYAYDFYHKGEYLPFKTPTDKLPSIAKYKQIVILVDNNTQSSAEIMASSLKKYHIGIVVGVPTKGWGTVERIFPLDNQISKTEKYSLFLVHSITLRDDNLPIEGRGVDPDVNIKDPNWQQQFLLYLNFPNLLQAVKEVL